VSARICSDDPAQLAASATPLKRFQQQLVGDVLRRDANVGCYGQSDGDDFRQRLAASGF
jgi:hypothetical protein